MAETLVSRRILLCSGPGLLVVATRIGVEIYRYSGGRWRLDKWVPAVNIEYVDVSEGRVLLRDGGEVLFGCGDLSSPRFTPGKLEVPSK